MKDLKFRIALLLEMHPKGGYYATEIVYALWCAYVIRYDVNVVIEFLKNDPDFFYDDSTSYVGWRLSKYR